MKHLKTIGNLLFVLTIVSPIIGTYIIFSLDDYEIFGIITMVSYSWILWLFIPFGVLSVLIGIKLKKHNEEYIKNYIVAFICVPLLFIWGSFWLVFGNTVSHDLNKVTTIEQLTEVDIPNQIKFATNIQTSYKLSYAKLLDEAEIEVFESNIKTNYRWRNKLSSSIESLLPSATHKEFYNCEYFLFYNITKNQFNRYPSDGKHECIVIAYDSDLQKLIILDDFIVDLY